MQEQERLPDFEQINLKDWFFKQDEAIRFLERFELTKTNLLIEAFTHKSFIHEYSTEINSYEKLEFLGDALLQSWISIKIYNSFSNLSEGSLSKLRSSLVNEEALSNLFDLLNIQNLPLLGKGEVKNKGNQRQSLKSDIFESILGAIYLDSGIQEMNNFLEEVMIIFKKHSGINFINESELNDFDPKSSFQELVMKHHKLIPEYRYNQNQRGEFIVSLYIGDKFIFKEINLSKKKAEKNLAKMAIAKEMYLIKEVK